MSNLYRTDASLQMAITITIIYQDLTIVAKVEMYIIMVWKRLRFERRKFPSNEYTGSRQFYNWGDRFAGQEKGMSGQYLY